MTRSLWREWLGSGPYYYVTYDRLNSLLVKYGKLQSSRDEPWRVQQIVVIAADQKVQGSPMLVKGVPERALSKSVFESTFEAD
jgi:hypothetical protein